MGLTLGVGVAVSVGVGVPVSVGVAVSVAVAVAVGVGVAVLFLGVPPSRPVERLLSPIWWPKTASSDAVTTPAPITAASRPVMTASRSGKLRLGGSGS